MKRKNQHFTTENERLLRSFMGVEEQQSLRKQPKIKSHYDSDPKS